MGERQSATAMSWAAPNRVRRAVSDHRTHPPQEIAMSTDIEVSLDRLAKDFRAVVTDAEALLQATASETGDRAVAARERIIDTLSDVKQRLVQVEQALGAKVKEVARATDDYVHEHPWQTVGVAAGIGFLIGMLISRR